MFSRPVVYKLFRGKCTYSSIYKHAFILYRLVEFLALYIFTVCRVNICDMSISERTLKMELVVIEVRLRRVAINNIQRSIKRNQTIIELESLGHCLPSYDEEGQK